MSNPQLEANPELKPSLKPNLKPNGFMSLMQRRNQQRDTLERLAAINGAQERAAQKIKEIQEIQMQAAQNPPVLREIESRALLKAQQSKCTALPAAIKVRNKGENSFRLIMGLEDAVRAAKAALALLDFDHIELVDRLVCMKKAQGAAKICVELEFQAISADVTEIQLYNCNRGLDSVRTELLRRQLQKLQSIIERVAA